MAEGRHKRDTDARRTRSSNPLRRPRFPLVALPAALVVTGGAVALGVALQDSPSALVATDAVAHAAPEAAASSPAATRGPVLSRALPRTKSEALVQGGQTRLAIDEAGAKRYAATDLNLWSAPDAAATQVGELATGDPALLTGRVLDGREEVVVDGVARWVTSGHLSATETTEAGLSTAPCPDMSVENRLKPQTIRLYRAVCHAFPQVTHYIGWGARSEHDTGNAIDVMVYGDKALGDKIAAWAQAHASELDLYDILWYHRIWTPVRAGEGWRTFADRGSATANHMDHVHLGTN